jgi:hypothetical protein
MPIEIGIWRINGAVERVQFSSIETEAKLETILSTDVSLLDPGLMIVGRQVLTAYGKIIDLLAVDADGALTVVELKRNKTPREVVAQVLDYASWVQTLGYEEITAIYAAQHPGEHFEQAFAARFDADPPERLNDEHRLLVVASELDSSTERIIGYLSANYGVPINAVFFRYFKEGTSEYLARTWLIDPNEAEAQVSKAAGGKGSREPWNGKDYYVSFGDGPHRAWEDAQRYGFVSAGGGKWYHATLASLAPGSRVFACIPKIGYVGVGTVTGAALPVTDFKVELDGQLVPILQAPHKASDMGHDAGDPDLCEHLVRVEWQKTVPPAAAVWEKGLFANQNSACRLRNKFTLDTLIQRFGLAE